MQIFYVHTTDLSSSTPCASFVLGNAFGFSQMKEVEFHLILAAKPEDCKNMSSLIKKYNLHFLDKINLHLYPRKFKKYHRGLFKFARNIIRNKSNGTKRILITRSWGFLPSLFFFFGGKNCYFETHDFYSCFFERNDIRFFSKISQIIKEKLFLSRLTGIITLSSPQEKLIKRYYPKITTGIFPTGIQSFIGKNRIIKKNEEIRLIYPGSVCRKKGMNQLLKVLSQVKGNWFLHIIGAKNKSEKTELESLLINNNIKNRVKISYWMPKPELHAELNQADIGIFALEDSFFNKNLTVPLKVLDFISAGLPFIGSNFDSVQSLVDNRSALLINWDETKNTALEITNFLNNTVKIEKMQKHLKSIWRNYLWSSRAKNLVKFFENNF